MALLSESVAVVTGGSSGIGRGISLAFAEHGADVVVADMREEPKEGGAPTSETIEDQTDQQSTFVECDVTKIEDLEAAVEAAEAFGGVSVMVNNAGIWHAEDFLQTTESDYQQMMDVNLKGAYFGCQAAARRMVESGGGSIINMSSIAGLFGNGDWPTYAASKGGVTMLTYSLAHKLGGDGIRVNAIAPGWVMTERQRALWATDEAVADHLKRQCLDRVLTEADMVGPCLFLASDLSAAVTSQVLVADGGVVVTG